MAPIPLTKPAVATTLAIAAVLVLAGCTSPNNADNTDIEGELVRIPGTSYDPTPLVIPAGTTVTWINDDPMHEHTVTPTDKQLWGTEGSGDAFNQWLRSGETWSFTFETPGTYEYICIPHAWETDDGWQGQVGIVIVEEA
jgi:plastocyanin